MAAAVAGEIIVFTALHELEMVTAMQLKLFRGEGKAEQAAAAIGLVHEDLASGKLVEAAVDWRTVLREAARLAQAHAARVGCRSLDILHCTVAKAARRNGICLLGHAADHAGARRRVTCSVGLSRVPL